MRPISWGGGGGGGGTNGKDPANLFPVPKMNSDQFTFKTC